LPAGFGQIIVIRHTTRVRTRKRKRLHGTLNGARYPYWRIAENDDEFMLNILKKALYWVCNTIPIMAHELNNT